MPITKSMTVTELQEQIEKLSAIIETQSQRAQTASEQIAALQAAARTSATPTVSLINEQGAHGSARIPDLIKLIPEFNGNPRNLARWIVSAEQKLGEAGSTLPAQERARVLPIWIGIIRDKITDKADDALAASHTPLEWSKIKETLIEYFGDKRDLSTLFSQLPALRQGSQCVTDFYHQCRSLLADINAKITLNEETRDHAKQIMATYETLVTNSFIDGLDDTLSDLTRSRQHVNLLSAFHGALEIESGINRRKDRKNAKPTATTTKPIQTQNYSSSMAPISKFVPYSNNNNNNRQAFPPARFPPSPNYQPNNFQRFMPAQNYPQLMYRNPMPNLAIKQEPRSRSGVRPTFASAPRTNINQTNMHEQCYDYYGYPPYTSQHQHSYDEYSQDTDNLTNESTTEEATPSNEETVNHDLNFSTESELNPKT